jgi:glycosyltransferase involved in cell wall biosynthesis
MRIAQVAPLYESVPPRLYGGTERIVSYLTEELVRLGHEVTLFASGDSTTQAKLVPACANSLWNDPSSRDPEPHYALLMSLVFQDVSRFDVIHFHTDFRHFPLLRHCPWRTVTTVHNQLREADVQTLFAAYPDVPLVSISCDQRRAAPTANWRATVYHGIPRDEYTFRAQPPEYLAFLGRISPEKGLDRAIEIARGAGKRLKVAAKIDSADREYFQKDIEPLLEASRSFVDFVGEVGGARKDDFLGNASALLFPIDWPEPFGLVMAESLACGTPVIAWNNGSVPEVIEHGRTGFIIESIADGIEAVHSIDALSREECRRVFEKRFDVTRMTRNYVDVYTRLKAVHRPPMDRCLPLAAGTKIPV